MFVPVPLSALVPLTEQPALNLLIGLIVIVGLGALALTLFAWWRKNQTSWGIWPRYGQMALCITLGAALLVAFIAVLRFRVGDDAALGILMLIAFVTGFLWQRTV